MVAVCLGQALVVMPVRALVGTIIAIMGRRQ
jgi:hypothetical protein